jgi:photosystem II Psb27 protein
MKLKPYLSRLLALVLVVVVGLVGCSASPGGITGNYSEDTVNVIENLLSAIELNPESADAQDIQTQARTQINEYIARYRRETKSGTLRSFTTMQTALNALASYYTSYGVRPIPDKLKNRLKVEFNQAKLAVERGN